MKDPTQLLKVGVPAAPEAASATPKEGAFKVPDLASAVAEADNPARGRGGRFLCPSCGDPECPISHALSTGFL